MPITLAQAKVGMANHVDQQVIDQFRRGSMLLEALTFDKVGDQSVHLTGLPAGAVVKVTEVYSGASYDLKSDNGVETVIKANDEYSQADAPVAEVSFVNDVNNSTNGGYGVINHFELNDKGLYDIAEVR